MNCPRCNAKVDPSRLKCPKCYIQLRNKKDPELIKAEQAVKRISARKPGSRALSEAEARLNRARLTSGF